MRGKRGRELQKLNDDDDKERGSTSTHTLNSPTHLVRMTTRSRTNLFLSYRDSCIRDTTPTTPFLSSNPYALDQDQAENAGLLDNSEDDWSRRGSTWSTVSSSSKGKARQNDVLPPQWLDYADKVDEIVQRVKPKSTYSPFSEGTLHPSHRLTHSTRFSPPLVFTFLVGSFTTRQVTFETSITRLQRSIS